MLPREWTYQGVYQYRVVSDFEPGPYGDLLRDLLGGVRPVEALLEEEQKEKAQALAAGFRPPVTLKIGVYREGRLVAFTQGSQTEKDAFHMGISVVALEHQRQGLYAELLRAVLEFTREAGFQRVNSTHHATNNPVLIAKLKAGFVITGLELSDGLGTQVQLTYFHNPERRRLLDARSGFTRPTGKLHDLFF